MEANRKRTLRSGVAYEHLFSRPTFTDSVISPNATIPNTVELVKQTVQNKHKQVAKLAAMLKHDNLRATCQAIWEFVYEHIQYKRDEAGKEQIRSPRRSWADRKTGVDCDCYTVFISSVLTNLLIPHILRVTKYKADWQHIYVIVPKDGDTSKNHPFGGNYYTLDCVTDQFDFEVRFSDKLDYPMKLYALDGLDDLGRKRDLSQDKAGEWKPKQRKTFFGKALQKVGRAVAKVGLAPIRAAFLLAFKINFKKIGSKLRWAYATPEEAQAKANINAEQYQRIKMNLLKIQDKFAKAGGNAANLKNAILRGKGNKDGKVALNGLEGFYDLDFAALPDTEWQDNTIHLGELGIAPAVLLPAVAAVIEQVLKMLKDVPSGEAEDDSSVEGLGSVQTQIAKAQRVIAKIEAIQATRALTAKETKALANTKNHLAALTAKLANANAKKQAKTEKKTAKATAKANKKAARKQKVNLAKELAKTETALKLAKERGDEAAIAEQTAKKEKLLESAKAQGIDVTKLISNAAIILRKVAQIVTKKPSDSATTSASTPTETPILQNKQISDESFQTKYPVVSPTIPDTYTPEVVLPQNTTTANNLLPDEPDSNNTTKYLIGGAIGLGILALAISSRPAPSQSKSLRGTPPQKRKKRKSSSINGFEAVPLS